MADKARSAVLKASLAKPGEALLTSEGVSPSVLTSAGRSVRGGG